MSLIRSTLGARALLLLSLLSACEGGGSGGGKADEGPAGGDGADGGGTAEDADGDGYAAGDDCDDADPEVNPGVVETCNGKDDDCDGIVDRDTSRPPAWFPDGDGDGVGAEGEGVEACEAPEGHVASTGDCDDADPTIAPGIPDNPCLRPGEDLGCDGVVDEPDGDGDGALDCADCDPADPDVFPGSVEVCGGGDEDCDGVIDEADAVGVSDWFADSDGDGWGDAAAATTGCDPGAGFVDRAGDCDDADPDASPGASERCGGGDEDCDGIVDEADAVDALAWHADRDGDTYGDPAAVTRACARPSGLVADSTDCDDARADVNPGALERCAAGDEDCDGLSGDADPSVADPLSWYTDADGDTYGDPAALVRACTQPAGAVARATDCDDGDATISPAGIETCDGVDEDCDGTADESAVGAPTWYPDADGDGYGRSTGSVSSCTAPTGYAASSTDCDDTRRAVYPGAPDVWYDGLDADCAGNSDYDADRDGYTASAYGGADCDDAQSSIRPGLSEVWYDGVDRNCDGADDYDADGDGYRSDAHGGSDCEDAVAAAYPGAAEVWYDGVDGDCDGLSDFDADRDGFDRLLSGGDDCDDADRGVHPYAWEDDSDGVDNDCDGGIDALDLDPVTDLDLNGEDDFDIQVTVSGFAFPFCGVSWSAWYLNTNGLMTFAVSTDDYAESASALQGVYAPAIAALWDDLWLDPLDAEVYGVVYPDAVGIYWRGVPEFLSSSGNDFGVILVDDGRVIFDLERVVIRDGLVGWSCGAGTTSAIDWTAEWAARPSGTLGVGTGTDGGLYELFSGSRRNDLNGAVLHACATAGVDGDGDGWTDVCGDPDDADAAVTP